MSSASTRSITILGHVDHGKTTFVDSLLAANNIISARMAGKIRYLDSREDEQERGITMESSAISLRFSMVSKLSKSTTSYTVNLIDTPGHVDFLSEVSTSSRLCDGALVLVDVVEGVCTQTIAVLRQAWQDNLRPVLVVNKFDRLITELKLSPSEGYHHLVQLIENVNAVMGSFYAGERMEDDLRWREERERRLAKKKDSDAARLEDDTIPVADDGPEQEFSERTDEDIYFAPERGNVIFASAIDGWAFRIGAFAAIYASKLGVNESNLRRALWGDFYLDPKTKRIVSHRQLKGRNLKPLFVQFVLENIWAVYENVVISPNPDKITKIVSALSLKIQPRDLRTKDTRHTLSLIFAQWLPLSTCTFQTVVEIVPPPAIAQRLRLPRMLHPDLNPTPGVAYIPQGQLEEDLCGCSEGDGVSVVAYVSKMFAVPKGRLPREAGEEPLARTKPRDELKDSFSAKDSASSAVIDVSANPEPETASADAVSDASNTDEDEETLLGFARLYSGTLTLSPSQPLYAILPKYNVSLSRTHPRNKPFVFGPIKVLGLYEMMGRDLVRVQTVHAGSVFAIEGLGGLVGRSATLCSGTSSEDSIMDQEPKDEFVNLAGVTSQVSPIVRVALEPKEPANMPQLIRGLKLLSQSDPCAEVFQQKTGEWVILTAGELHLERCLKDLRERFAKIEIQASQPIVPFRETIVKTTEMLAVKSPLNIRGVFKASSHGVVTFTVRAKPLPLSITQFLQTNVSILKRIQSDMHTAVHAPESDRNEDVLLDSSGQDEPAQRPTVGVDDFWPALGHLLDEAGQEWSGLIDSIWTFGPNRIGPNILFHGSGDSSHISLKQRSTRKKNPDVAGQQERQSTGIPPEFETNIETGFQRATFQGPLCAEPVEGVAYFIEALQFDDTQFEGENVNVKIAQGGGSLVTACKEACHNGFLDWSPRLKLAVYSCDIQASTDVLGKVYAVIARRRGRIVSEEMKEGTSFFSIHATLPVIESFGFASDIRKRSSGAASPQLIFSGYEILDQDPFWVPTTDEELEDLGDKADRANVARVYMDKVRKRKGMFVEQKVVEAAEKQRTLKR